MGGSMSALQILKGHVYHSRNHEVRHSFRYPTFALLFSLQSESEYLQILKKKTAGLLSLKASDYLQGEAGSLKQAIVHFLKERCQYEAEEIVLQTFPRMFGYAFNPVSFWYCLRAGKLEAVLCEVNNTFGERHFYFIRPEGGIRESEFYRSEKVFHVSPFFPVDGFYKFRFHFEGAKKRVDIFYYDASEQLRFTSWIEGRVSDFANESMPRLFWSYGWMTPLVVMRIHWQAAKLWLKRVTFYKKPTPPHEEVT